MSRRNCKRRRRIHRSCDGRPMVFVDARVVLPPSTCDMVCVGIRRILNDPQWPSDKALSLAIITWPELARVLYYCARADENDMSALASVAAADAVPIARIFREAVVSGRLAHVLLGEYGAREWPPAFKDADALLTLGDPEYTPDELSRANEDARALGVAPADYVAARYAAMMDAAIASVDPWHRPADQPMLLLHMGERQPSGYHTHA